MTDKELKNLSRAELVDILYDVQKQSEEKDALIADLKAKIGERAARVSQCGTIAEAALQTNGVLEAAQKAADEYLASVRAAQAGNEQRLKDAELARQRDIRAAKEEARQIVAEAGAQAKSILAEAESGAEEKWKTYDRRVNELIGAHAELQAFIRSGHGK